MMKSQQKIRKYLLYCVQGFLIAYALCKESHLPLVKESFETGLDYLIANIYELLGEYDLPFLVVAVLGVCYFSIVKKYIETLELQGEKKDGLVIFGSLFFAFWSIVGRSFYATNSFSYIFGSLVNFLKSVMMFAGYSLLWREAFEIGFLLLDRLTNQVKGEECGSAPAISRRSLVKKIIIILSICYLPVVFLSFPGNLCYDSCGQITQVMTGVYTEHAPLFHTLVMGGLTVLGGRLGSLEAGLFLYTLLQVVLLEGAFIWVLLKLQEEGVEEKLLLGLAGIYGITPIYSNLVSTPIKDIPFVSFVYCYVLCYAMAAFKRGWIDEAKNGRVFVFLQILVILSRNNGFYLVVLSGIALWVTLLVQNRKKLSNVEAKNCKSDDTAEDISKHSSIVWLFKTFLISALLGKLLMISIAGILDAEPGSKGEMLSIPFQQTARYVQLYRAEISDADRDCLQAVLGDLGEVAIAYDPNISDPVKALYIKDSTKGDLARFLLTWGKLFFKHPVVYIEAFTAHIYGWFSPFVSNAIRYEATWDQVMPRSSFGELRYKVLIFLYRFAERISILGLLENVGIYVWLMFLLTFYCRRKGMGVGIIALSPMYVSLLICMASPCFFKHPRYALPIMISMPMLLLLTSRFVNQRE